MELWELKREPGLPDEVFWVGEVKKEEAWGAPAGSSEHTQEKEADGPSSESRSCSKATLWGPGHSRPHCISSLTAKDLKKKKKKKAELIVKRKRAGKEEGWVNNPFEEWITL